MRPIYTISILSGIYYETLILLTVPLSKVFVIKNLSFQQYNCIDRKIYFLPLKMFCLKCCPTLGINCNSIKGSQKERKCELNCFAQKLTNCLKIEGKIIYVHKWIELEQGRWLAQLNSVVTDPTCSIPKFEFLILLNQLNQNKIVSRKRYAQLSYGQVLIVLSCLQCHELQS